MDLMREKMTRKIEREGRKNGKEREGRKWRKKIVFDAEKKTWRSAENRRSILFCSHCHNCRNKKKNVWSFFYTNTIARSFTYTLNVHGANWVARSEKSNRIADFKRCNTQTHQHRFQVVCIIRECFQTLALRVTKPKKRMRTHRQKKANTFWPRSTLTHEIINWRQLQIAQRKTSGKNTIFVFFFLCSGICSKMNISFILAVIFHLRDVCVCVWLFFLTGKQPNDMSQM